MKKIINKTKQNNLKESLIPVTEGGIYALNIDLEAAADAFEDKLRDIFQVDSISMEYDRSGIDLELIPARGWVNNDPYFRATIHGLEEVIYKLMDDKYKKLVDENEVKINPYSDFEITGWKPTDYQNGVTLDAYTHTFDNEEEYAALDTESDRIGKEIAKIIFSHYDELVSLLSEFVEYDEYEDDELDDYEESLIPIEEASHPKLGKKVKSLKGWKIYQGTDTYGNEIFRCFTPDEVRPAVGYEDWETDTLEQAISWIENYDLKESKKTVNESNKELARIAFEDILKPFNGTDIKYTDETEDAEFKTHSYVANIISTPQYVELIKKLIDSDKYEYDPDFNDYVKYTEYGQITIIIEDKYITIEVMYNNDEDYFDENLILIKESAFDNDFILDIVKMGYETGHQIFDSYEDFIEDEEVQDIDDKEAAWDFYCDLIDMGPAGFYEEYRDELDFDPSFIAEYGEDENY